jgi:hypothetical protein
MIKVLTGIFVVLHGLVHLWYLTLSQGWVEFQADMGWTGKSWLFTNLLGDQPTRTFTSLAYILATLGFVAGGIGIFTQQDWLRPFLIGSAAFSSALILLFWDGSGEMLVQKGLLGLLINLAVLVAMLVFKLPVPST